MEWKEWKGWKPCWSVAIIGWRLITDQCTGGLVIEWWFDWSVSARWPMVILTILTIIINDLIEWMYRNPITTEQQGSPSFDHQTPSTLISYQSSTDDSILTIITNDLIEWVRWQDVNKDPCYRLSYKASNGRFYSMSYLYIMLDLLQSNAAFIGGWMGPIQGLGRTSFRWSVLARAPC